MPDWTVGGGCSLSDGKLTCPSITWVGVIVTSLLDYDWVVMITSSKGNIFRVTGPLWEESTGDRWIPSQRPVTRGFDVFFDQRLNKRLSRQSRRRWFETPSRSSWRHCIMCLCVVGWSHCLVGGMLWKSPKLTIFWKPILIRAIILSFPPWANESTNKHTHRVSADTRRKKHLLSQKKISGRSPSFSVRWFVMWHTPVKMP